MFVIGSLLQPNEALETLSSEYGEFNFPLLLSVENLMPMAIVDSQVILYLESHLQGQQKGDFLFPTFGHLMKFVTDMEVLARTGGYERAVIISAAENTAKTAQQAVENDEKFAKSSDNERKRGRKPAAQVESQE